MTTTSAPTLIQAYFDAALDPDPERYVALFAPDATVEDDGRTMVGRDAVREWRSAVPDVTYVVQEVVEQDGGWTARTTVAGDFSGSPVDLRHWFRFDAEGLVAELRIRP